jgi:hypothetical protein
MRKPQHRILIYLTAEEDAHMRTQAKKRGFTVSRYTRDLLIEAAEAEKENALELRRLIGGVQTDLHTMMAMVDRLAALSASDEDYRAWQQAVEAALHPREQRNGRGARDH